MMLTRNSSDPDDVNCVFLNHKLEQEVYVEQSSRLIDSKYLNHVCRFDKTL